MTQNFAEYILNTIPHDFFDLLELKFPDNSRLYSIQVDISMCNNFYLFKSMEKMSQKI